MTLPIEPPDRLAYCPTAGKICYRQNAAAMKVRDNLRKRRTGLHAYLCQHCNQFHLGRQFK